jgi:succinate dehydrogenase/fumarate reductase flavoprotein subunit
MKQFDFIVLGSGIAGLSFALKVAPHGRVAIVTKKDRAESNTNYAQGGIASVTSKEDSFELHVRDTLTAGAGLCREDVVRTIIEEGPGPDTGADGTGHEIFRTRRSGRGGRPGTGFGQGRRALQAAHFAREGRDRPRNRTGVVERGGATAEHPDF